MKQLHRLTLLASACLSLGAMSAAQAAPKRVSKPVAAAAAPSREAELIQRLDQLSVEMAQLKAQLAELKQQAAKAATDDKAVVASPVVAPAPAVVAPPVTTVANGVDGGAANGAGAAGVEPATVLTGYGEINYNRYNKDASRNQADVRRVVLGMQHRVNEKTKIVTELEVEHSVSSADDVGEVAIEQAYAERQLNDRWALRAGLFLMPSGLLNENHEPTAYYGVERNFVETAIIPSTWREGGVQLVGNFDNGLTLQTGLSTSFDVSKWATDDAETAESPLGSVHQEMSQAHAKDPAVFAALNWRGLPGLQLGGSWFSGNGGQGQAAAAGNSLRVTLWDLHARYTLGGLDLSSVYARGTISGTAAFNTLNIGSGPDWYPIPKSFDGVYVQAAYKLWSSDDLSLSPFVRAERFNTRKSFADIGQGLTADAAATRQVYTLGANLNVGQGLVFKADIQRFKHDGDNNRLDLGLGWSF
ncbi:MAG TPA: porin [Aquabacterium sp.]|uniref:porin n=1 Tax=Aquabacterium sp. TaxID=1872578 RepID=UPI002E328BD0|nr:porin [Aquabacterium sp.]HEX5354706.1 porin [Aquabacterium sp.]